MFGHSGLISGSANRRGKIRDAIRDSFHNRVGSLPPVNGCAEKSEGSLSAINEQCGSTLMNNSF